MDVFIGHNWDFPGTLPALLLVGPESLLDILDVEHIDTPCFSILKLEVNLFVVVHRVYAIVVYTALAFYIKLDVRSTRSCISVYVT